MLGGIAALGWVYIEHGPDGAEEPLDTAALEFQRIAERADRAIKDRRARRVLEDVEAFVQRHPHYALGWRLLGQVRYSIGRRDLSQRPLTWPAAYEAWQQSLELDPEDKALHLLAGDLALRLERAEVARRHFETLLELDPTRLTYQVRLCWALIHQGHHDEAEAGLKAVLRRDAAHHEAHYYYGVLSARRAAAATRYTEQEARYIEALDWIRSAIKHLRPREIEKRDVMVKYLRQQSYILRQLATARGGDMRTLEQALAILTRQLFPPEIADPEVLEEIAQCHAMMDRPERAAELYARYAGRERLNWQYHARAAHWWLVAGDRGRAAEHFEQLRQLDPQLRHNPVRQQTLADLHRRLETADAAADPSHGLDGTGGLY